MSGALRVLTGAMSLRRGDSRIANRERAIKNRVLRTIGEKHGRNRRKRARRLVALASASHESPAESRLRWFFAYWGFPCPREQVRVGRRYIDFGFERWRIAVEFDGYAKLATNATDLGQMLRRDEELNAAGWRVLHVTWNDFDAPEALARRLATAFPARAGIRLHPRQRYL